MPKRLKSFRQKRDRSNPEKARELFNFLWPSQAVRNECANRLAQSIQCAHKRAEASWEVTMFDWGIRVNVGQVLVLQLDSDRALIYARAPRGHVYAAVQIPCRIIKRPVADIAAVAQRDWKDHERFIAAALEAKGKSPFKASFSEGALREIEEILRRKLPRPSYMRETTSMPPERRSIAVAADVSSEMELLEAPAVKEGRLFLATHFRRERNRKIVEEKKRAAVEATGHLACEVCTFDFRAYGKLGEGFCEVHHLRSLSSSRTRVTTKPDDLAIACSNCHRMIHYGGKTRPLSAVRAALRFDSNLNGSSYARTPK